MTAMTGSRAGSRLGRILTMLAAALGVLACGVNLQPGGTGAGCLGTRCPPPSRSVAAAHVFKAQRFSFEYFDPWQIDSQDARGAVVFAGTQYGDLTVQLTSTDV